MATRAIRYDQLKTDSARTATEVTVWANYNQNDTDIWHPLQVAVQHQIEFAGIHAYDLQVKIAALRNEVYSCGNYMQVMDKVYGFLLPEIVKFELSNTTLPTLMREKLITMRKVMKSKQPTDSYYDGRTDGEFVTAMTEMTSAMFDFTRVINLKYFAGVSPNPQNIISSSVNYSIVDANTTDAQIEDMVSAKDWSMMWRMNTYYLLQGGYDRPSVAHQYPAISDDMMKTFMENLIENHPAIALRIAQNDQFFQDNPMAQSIGHSWTSRNRSDDCWFKVSNDQVNKSRTIVFAPPRKFFGKFTPSLFDMTNHIETFKEEVRNFIKSAQPQINAKIDAAKVLTDKTDKAHQEAIVGLVQGLLDDKDTVSVGTAMIGHISGIAYLPIDASSFPNHYAQFTYYDFTRKQDMTQYLYPHNMKGIVSLSDFNVTDEVQQVIYKAYQENLASHRTQHANNCAQLARQISQQTTRHDAEMNGLTVAFKEYQAQV